MKYNYLTVNDVLDIHNEQLERYGGATGVRNQAGLESAISRPQSGYYDSII